MLQNCRCIYVLKEARAERSVNVSRLGMRRVWLMRGVVVVVMAGIMGFLGGRAVRFEKVTGSVRFG